MIPHGVEIFVGVEPIDLRWGFDRLSGIVSERIARLPRSGALYVFFGKRRDAIKILFADASGICVFYKRLDRGVFRLPPVHEVVSGITLFEGRAVEKIEGRVARVQKGSFWKSASRTMLRTTSR
jgi:transposase